MVWCSGCKAEHPVEAFHKNRTTKNGLANCCKIWCSQYRKKQYTDKGYHRRWNESFRREVIAHYGEKCECCGESEMEFLVLDHIDGGGTKHRQEVGFGTKFYKWLKKQAYPSGYRVLCHNCNWSAYKNGGTCIHQLEKKRDSMKHLLFCYGTLKKSHTRHRVIAEQRYLGTAILKPTHKMIYLGGFPALVPALAGDGSKVRGELYEVDDNCLTEVDKVEGVDQGLFKREPLEIESHVPMMLPTQQTTFNKLEKGEVEGYVYAREYGNARDCGVFWF